MPRREALLLVVAFALLTVLRLRTVAHDPWEWDELLFLQGARDGLDVRINHPHPPGYPGFVYPARLLVALGASPFGAVTAVGTLGGLLAVLGVYALTRAFGSRRPFAALAAATYALIPAVWLHSVRPLTDGLGAAVFLLAATFLVRAIRGGAGRDLVTAAFLSGWAAAVRPQEGIALLPAALVAALAVWRRERRPESPALAAGAGLAVSLAFWLPAIASSGGFAGWREKLAAQVAFVRTFEAPGWGDVARSSFWKRWWYDPFGSSDAAFAVLACALLAFVLDRRRAALVLALFLPVTALTIGTLGRIVAPRYAVAFLPLPAILLALSAERLAQTRLRATVMPTAALLLAFLALPAVPAIVEVHERTSPSVAVMQAARAHPTPAVRILGGFLVHAREYLPGRAIREAPDGEPVVVGPDELLVWEDDVPVPQAPLFRTAYRERAMLKRISRGRYLVATLTGPGGEAAR